MMDQNRFDAMTATIATASSRRGLVAALLGGTLAFLGADSLSSNLVGAAQKGDGARCDDDSDCGKGLTCQKVRNRGSKRRECRYEDGCGEQNNYCDEDDDCCKNLTCDGKRNRCVK